MLRRFALALAVLAGLAAAAVAADPAKAGRLQVGIATVDAVDTARGRTIPTEI